MKCIFCSKESIAYFYGLACCSDHYNMLRQDYLERKRASDYARRKGK